MTNELKRPRPPPGAELYTVGHSNHSIEHFLPLLRRHGIEVVADVRSRPYSRFVPHFSKERLARLLEDSGIGYLFLGHELGGKPLNGETHASPITYQARVAQPQFREGVDRLLQAAGTTRVALLCRERDPLDCHRFHLVCRYVRAPDWKSGTFSPTAKSRRSRRPNAGSLSAPARLICPCSRTCRSPEASRPWRASTMRGGRNLELFQP